MTTIALRFVGSALGTAIGGPIGGAIGGALGATAGAYVDRALFAGGGRMIEGPRLTDRDGISSQEGAGIPRVYGRVRLGGQVIWATEFEESRSLSRAGSSGGKSGASSGQKVANYSYSANVAIGLCEGPISFVRRIWADGKPLDLTTLTMRVYTGTEDQEPDGLIVAKQETGEMPGFRGLAYVVFERFPLADYGNRLPQFSFEVVRAAPGLPDALRAINLIPGSTEFGYETRAVREDFGRGSSRGLNRSQMTHLTDWEASLDQLQALAPNLERVSLISAWFGDDLRVETCSLRPMVEKASKVTLGAEWRAAGLNRASARVVSSDEGRPNYGGSPSDESIIGAIRDLKTRGLKVALNPFILMDIPAGNGLADPYSASSSQPPFPWRGRITCYPAPGRAGSPEGSGAIDAGIAAFFGTASASQFTQAGDSVLFSGGDDWGYRRMVLHHAMLAKAAGGVDTFFLGSELVGLTHLMGAGGGFPAVAQLKALASEVRAILGANTLITYAADWTEYGARVRNGGQDVSFPLDPLWADAEIGAVAIDFYPPISDWRAGRAHLDAYDAGGPHNPAYLQSRITSGEAYDWYYADAEGRAAQTRLPISDGVYGKPWTYRPKDIAGWWGNTHHPRIAGVEGAATGWQPGAKPILLAEIGCPAVDKGANQPNVFPDPKSIENALPHFSTGARDDLMQWRMLEALFARYGAEDAVHNPVSAVYGEPMVRSDFIAPWAFDARPYPAFPLLKSQWADGANMVRGHWLNGRLEGMPVEQLIGMIADDAGLGSMEDAGISGFVDGYVIDRPMSARAALTPVLSAFGVMITERDGQMRIATPVEGTAIALTRDLLMAGEEGQAEVTRHRPDSGEAPGKISLAFLDSEREFRRTNVSATHDNAANTRESGDETSLVMPRGTARAVVERLLAARRAERETVQLVLSASVRGLEIGDCITLPDEQVLYRVERIEDGEGRKITARRFLPDIAIDGDGVDEDMPEPGVPASPGEAHVKLLELPLDRGADAGPLMAAVQAIPWRGPYSLARIESDGGSDTLGSAEAPTIFGSTLSALPPGPLWRWDTHATLDVVLDQGALASASNETVLGGRNLLALIGTGGAIELIQFRQATLTGTRRYRLTGLLRGVALSEGEAMRTLPIGAEFAVVDGAMVDLGADIGGIGANLDILCLPAGRSLDDGAAVRTSATLTGIAKRPLMPVHARARRENGGVRIRFIRRARRGGDSWELYEVPLGEEHETYRLEVMGGSQVKRNIMLTSTEWLYPTNEELADFGAGQGWLDIRVRQISGAYGEGEVLSSRIRVN